MASAFKRLASTAFTIRETVPCKVLGKLYKIHEKAYLMKFF